MLVYQRVVATIWGLWLYPIHPAGLLQISWRCSIHRSWELTSRHVPHAIGTIFQDLGTSYLGPWNERRSVTPKKYNWRNRTFQDQITGWWFQTFFFHFIYGMSSFQNWLSYFTRWLKPPTRVFLGDFSNEHDDFMGFNQWTWWISGIWPSHRRGF